MKQMKAYPHCGVCPGGGSAGSGGMVPAQRRQPPELTTVATYQAECGRAVMVEELVARVADHSSYEVTLSGDGAVSQDGKCITFPKTGTFPVTVEAVDAKGNRVQQTVTVTAVDKTPPELTVKTIKTTVGKKIDYKKAVKAVDVVDGDLEPMAVQVSDIYVNHKQVGSYTAIYTVTDQAGNRAEARGLVIVNPVKADKLQLSSKELYLNGNQYAALTPTVTPKTWAGTVEWTSSDPDVATVSDGLVTWVAPGTCTITAKGGQAEGDLRRHLRRSCPVLRPVGSLQCHIRGGHHDHPTGGDFPHQLERRSDLEEL